MSINLSAKGFENVIRLLAPVGLLAALFLISVVALPFPRIGQIQPAFILMAVYYWSIYRPTLMPPWVCFFIGLLLDFICGQTLGVNAIIFTLVQWIVRDQRKFLMGQPYVTIWFVFALVAGLSLSLQWTLYGLVDMQWAPLPPVILSMMATFLLFPVVTLFLILVHRVLPSIQKAYP
jgi:rod shape-determining protein MreD